MPTERKLLVFIVEILDRATGLWRLWAYFHDYQLAQQSLDNLNCRARVRHLV
jgi:hypothetical protein